MKSLDKYISTLSGKEIFQMIKNYEELSDKGFIGDCPLRSHSKKFMAILNVGTDSMVVLWMDRLGMACYKNLALKYIENNSLEGYYKE